MRSPRSSAAETFHLSKWYLDCVSDEGEVFLAYRAALRWRALRIHYASVLGRDASLRKSPSPVEGAGVLEWRAPSLEVEGRWERLDPPIRRTLAEGVEWDCVQPRARAEVRVGRRLFRGLGYAEHLTLAIPPWLLPLDELRWGRFLSPTDGLVWIDWRGPQNRQLVFHNGVSLDSLPGLDLEDGLVLRDGSLAETVLSVIPKFERLFPSRILRLRESKWRSRGILRRAGAPDARGWAIHEVVRWR